MNHRHALIHAQLCSCWLTEAVYARPTLQCLVMIAIAACWALWGRNTHFELRFRGKPLLDRAADSLEKALLRHGQSRNVFNKATFYHIDRAKRVFSPITERH